MEYNRQYGNEDPFALLNPDIAVGLDDRRRNFDFRQERRCFFAQAYLMYVEHKKVPADTA